MKTLGQIFQDKRTQLGITIDQASHSTRIRAIYLHNIENGNYDAIPIAIQVKGFITIYARFLGIEPEEALAFYRREHPTITKNLPLRFKLPSLKKATFHITSQLIVTICIFLMITGAISYVLWQYFRFVGAPKLEIYSPRDGLVIQSNTLKIEGTVSEDTKLTLNNTTIPVNNNGYFSQDIPLDNNINVLTFVAVNTSGKSTTIKRIVRSDPN